MRFATLHGAAEAIERGLVTPVELLDTCLAAIDRLEPQVSAWVFVDGDRARGDAEGLTEELRHGRRRGPLHGIPLAVKDIFDVFDWPTGCGSRLWSQSVARRDASVVDRLRRAGAVFLGKTVTTPYASFDPPVTRNPWDRSRTPGGSSSGSAAAVACGMCLGALASQTGGSITRPASYCGVAGCKPTYGRVSTDGVLPLAASMDHVGAIGHCVRDLALLLQVIAGPDPRDPLCSDRAVPDLTTPAIWSPVPRLGRVRGLFDDLAEAPVRNLMDAVASRFQSRGAAVRDIALPPGFAEVLPRHRTVMAVEAAAYHGTRLRRHPDDYQPKIRALLEEGLACPVPDHARCKAHQQQLARDLLGCFHDVDALLTPATTSPAPDRSTTGDPAFNSPWSYTGLPTVSIPAGWSDEGLPLAIQLVGRPWAEAELLAVAAWCEEVLAVEQREPPGST
ncbi:MAG TPA: amidase [Gemmataceae bacterium]|jgi:aspartyl-tRNA(Asn)/glutamyl-tRNA(Gln) amidotransferase subunit A|nr:amidase [Gemmataceae bacterium]